MRKIFSSFSFLVVNVHNRSLLETPPTALPHRSYQMADNKDALRTLKIKIGVLTRVKKELAMYRTEVTAEGAKLEKMKAEGMDPHDIKQQDQVLGESSMMIGDCTTRMENAFNDLLAAMVRVGV